MIGMVELKERRGRKGEYGKGEGRWNGVCGVSEEHWFNCDFRHALL